MIYNKQIPKTKNTSSNNKLLQHPQPHITIPQPNLPTLLIRYFSRKNTSPFQTPTTYIHL